MLTFGPPQENDNNEVEVTFTFVLISQNRVGSGTFSVQWSLKILDEKLIGRGMSIDKVWKNL